MKAFKVFFAIVFTMMLGVNGVLGQPWTYDFGTGTGSHTSSTASTSFLPTPASGTSRVRVGNNPGSITLANPGISNLGTGSQLQITSNTASTSATKFSIYDYTASKTGYLKFKVAFSGGTDGVYHLSIGDGVSFSDNNNVITSQVFACIQWSLGTSNAITYRVLSGSSYVTTGISNSTTLFSQSTSNIYTVEIYFNNRTTSSNYSKDGTSYSLANAKWDLWVDGTRRGAGLAKGGLSTDVTIDSYSLHHQSSVSTPGTIYLDDIEYSNALPPSITGSATATSFTTTYGTASSEQSFSVSGSNLTADLIATAPTGFEVSSDGTTYGSTATFTQSGGSASGTLRIRLAATASVTGSYNSQNIVLSSTGATSVNITTASSGNAVSAKSLTITAADQTVILGTAANTVTGNGSYTPTGFVNSETSSVISGTVTYTTTYTSSTTAGTNVATITPVTTSLSATNYTFSAANGNISVRDVLYSKSSGSLNTLSSWGTSTDGTGTQPSNFTSNGITYQIRNQSSPTISASWTVSGTGSKVEVGDGVTGVDFSIPSGMTLSISGDLTNRSTISGAGTVVMNGSSAQTISGIGTISNLEINNSSGVTISSGSNMQSLTGVLTPTAGTLTTNGNLTLKSSSTTTARVAAGSSSGGYISGNVSVERYFASNKQAWRLVTAPVAGSSSNFIYDHWQSSTTGGATGVEIWGPTGSPAPTGSGGANGLAYHATVSSMRQWDNNPSGPAYANVTNTKTTTLFTADGTNPKSFFLFVAGPIGDGSVPASYSAVKVRATGALRQGNQTFSIASPTGSAFYLVGNPYASPVDHGNSGTSGSPSYPLTLTNTTNQIWLWDPNLSGANGVGGYVSFDRLNNAYSVVAGGSTGLSYTDGASYTRLQSGQAFFVKASASPSGNLTVAFTESSKGSGITGGVFRGQDGETSEKMRITLQRNYFGEYTTTDGAVAFFYPGGAKEVNDMDGQKLMNASSNIMFHRNGTNLTFEHRPLVESTDTLFLNLRSTSTGAYRLVLTGSDFDNSNKLIPVLQDTYLNKEQILKLDSSVNYDFEIDDNATASSGERFRIVFTSKATSPLEFDPRHTIQGYPNPVRTGGQLSLKFNDRPAGNYTVVFNSLQGVRVQQQVVQHAGGTAVQSIKLSSKLTPGSYLVNILDASSRNVESLKVIIQ